MNKEKSFYIKLVAIFSTFTGYCAYLAFLSNDPFLDRWISGSFAFFVALVIANIIRANTFGKNSETSGDGPPEGG